MSELETDDEEIILFECPIEFCRGTPKVLGTLGNKLWLRCQNCGIDYYKENKKEDS